MLVSLPSKYTHWPFLHTMLEMGKKWIKIESQIQQGKNRQKEGGRWRVLGLYRCRPPVKPSSNLQFGRPGWIFFSSWLFVRLDELPHAQFVSTWFLSSLPPLSVAFLKAQPNQYLNTIQVTLATHPFPVDCATHISYLYQNQQTLSI